jgi:hypothetical protein
VCVCVLVAGALSACDSTLQSTAIPHNLLEYMVESPYPVFWLGATFEGMPVGEANHDPSDAWSVSYGNCVEGGEGSCVPPLELVTSPDNSFLPGAGGAGSNRTTRIRGVPAVLSRGGKTIALATAGVVLDIYATSARVAAAAARAAVAINQPAASGAPLAPALPDTGFGETPLPAQVPSPLRKLP